MKIQNPFKFARKNAYWAITLVLILTALGSNAQTTNDNSGVMMFIVGLVAIVAVMVLLVAIYALQVINKLEKDQPAGSNEEDTLWSRFLQIANNRAPEEKEADIMMDHNYDGIRELDNHLPPWWKWLFYMTIIWGAVYLIGHHFTGWFPLQEEEYETEMAEANASKKASQEASADAGGFDVTTLEYTADAAMIEAGKKTFGRNCVACHGAVGQGNAVGPNLTDEYWLHGGGIKNVFNTITNGAPNGMIAWKTQMSPTDIRDLANYVLSIAGSNPPDGKKPQGTIYEEGAAATENTEAPAASEEAAKEVVAEPVASADLEVGKAVYASNCAACHLADGGGVVGPNLTDKYWKNSNGNKEGIKKTINEGVAGTAMVAWSGILSEAEVDAVTNFVMALQGTTPAAPKAPEGDLYE